MSRVESSPFTRIRFDAVVCKILAFRVLLIAFAEKAHIFPNSTPRKQAKATSERVHTNTDGEFDYCCLWGVLSMFCYLSLLGIPSMFYYLFLSELQPTLAPRKQTKATSESDPDSWTVKNDGNNVRLNFVLSKKPDKCSVLKYKSDVTGHTVGFLVCI
jgi:hypothetical protein